MISISKANVPDYLVGSDFYNALSSDDTEEFSIPEGNLKLSLSLADVDDLRHSMNTLRFWGTHKYPDELLLFLLGSQSGDARKEVRSVLIDCSSFPELVSLHDSLEEILNPGRSKTCYLVRPIVGVGWIPTLIKCLASTNDALVQRAQIELKRLVNFSAKTASLIMSELNSNINRVKLIDALPPDIQRYVADLIVCSYQKSAHDETVFQSLLPILLFFLHSTDDELISGSCKVLKTVSQWSEDCYVRAIINDRVLPRLVTLVSHLNHTIQADVAQTVSYIIYAHRQFAAIFVAHNVFRALGTVLLDTSQPKETHKTIVSSFEMLAIKTLLYPNYININSTGIHGQALLNELMHTCSEVLRLTKEPELQLSCACIIVYVHSKCSDDNIMSDFNKAWAVCKSMGFVDKALASPVLVGITTTYLPL